MKQLSNDKSLFHRIILVLALIVIFVNALKFGMMKEDFFFDEKCSFSISNMSDLTVGQFWQILVDNDFSVNEVIAEIERIHLTSFLGVKHTDEAVNSIFHVRESNRFKLFGTILADTVDSHPPLYYLLIHILCSFFMDMPLRDVGLIINYVSLMVTCFLVYKICKKHVDGFFAIVATLFYGLSFDFINNVTYIRNYAMLTMWVALLMYLNYDLLDKNGVLNKKRMVQVAAVEILAMLTQFFAAFFIIPMFVFTLIRIRAQGSLVKKYVSGQVITGVIYLLIWPVSVAQVLFDESAAEVRGSIFSMQFLGKIKGFANLMRNSLFVGNYLIMFVAITVIAAAFIFFLKDNVKGKRLSEALSEEKIEYAALLFIPTAFFYLLAVISSPWAADRYVMAAIPEISIILLLAIRYLGMRLIKNETICNMILAAIVVLSFIGNMSMTPYYLYPMNAVKQNFIDNYSEKEAIVVEPYYHAEFLDAFISVHHKYWTIVREEELDDFLDSHSGDYSSFVMYANNSCKMDEVLDCFDEHGFILKSSDFTKDFYKVYIAE